MSRYTMSMPNALYEKAQRLATRTSQSVDEIIDKNARGTITADEFRELAELVERGQRLTLRKSQAMKLLLDRGYAVSL